MMETRFSLHAKIITITREGNSRYPLKEPRGL